MSGHQKVQLLEFTVFLYILFGDTIFNTKDDDKSFGIKLFYNYYNNKKGMMGLNLVCLILLFILKMQCLQLQRHQGVQHDQTQVLVGIGSTVVSAFVTDKTKIAYFLLLVFLAIYIQYLTIATIVEYNKKTSRYNGLLSYLMSQQEKSQSKLKFINSKLKFLNEDKTKLKFPIIDKVAKDEQTKTIKITKKIEVMQWRQIIDFMPVLKIYQITIFGLLNHFTKLAWVDKNEGIKGGKINNSNNWKLQNESQCKIIQLQILHKNRIIRTIIQKNVVQELFSNYNKGNKFKLDFLKEEDKQKIRYNITNQISELTLIELKILQKEKKNLEQIIKKQQRQLINVLEIQRRQQSAIIKSRLDILKEGDTQLRTQITNYIKSKNLHFDEKFIYLLSRQSGQDKIFGSLRISFQFIQLKDQQYINFVAQYDELYNKIQIYKGEDGFYFDVIIGQELTKEKYFNQLYWRKNSGRILFTLQIGVLITLGVFIGIFSFKVIITDNKFLDSLCRAHNLLMGFIFIYNTVWLIFAIIEVNLMRNRYWNLVSMKQYVLFCSSIVISLWIIITLIERQASRTLEELNTALNAQS